MLNKKQLRTARKGLSLESRLGACKLSPQNASVLRNFAEDRCLFSFTWLRIGPRSLVF